MTFSIIIPVYNVAPYLKACLDSVCAQTCEKWEAICVDDGSTDGSGAILDEYAAQDPRFRVIHQANRGVSAARNAALEIATGDWILFVDADDVVSPNWLEKVQATIESDSDVDIIRWDMREFEKDPTFDEFPKGCRTLELGAELSNDAFTWNFWRQAYRRSNIEGLKFPPYVIGEDLVYSYTATFRAKKIAVIDQVLYGYRVRPGSAMNSKMSARKVQDVLMYGLYLLGLEGDRKYDISLRRMIVNRMTETFWFFARDLEKCDFATLAQIWFEKAKVLPMWRVRIACFFKSQMIALLLFALPRYLKTKGFHR